MYENYLYHHGIKGQKWGIRRYQNPDGTLTAAGRRRLRKEEKKSYERQKKETKKALDNIKGLSNEELTTLRDRLILENKVKELSDSDVSYGKEKFKKMLIDVGSSALSDVLTPALKTSAKKAVAKLVDDDTAELMFGKEYRSTKKPKTDLEKIKEAYDLEKAKNDLAIQTYNSKNRDAINRALDAKRNEEYYKNISKMAKSRDEIKKYIESGVLDKTSYEDISDQEFLEELKRRMDD